MILILLGAPGSGKGTQAKYISGMKNIPHISTGDMFRDAVQRDTAVGQEAKACIDAGNLVPDSVTVRIAEERFSLPDCQSGFLLDGFPRTIPQAEALEGILKKTGRELTAVLFFDLENEILVQRLSLRRMCKKCGKIFQAENLKENGKKCDECGGKIYQREDDKPEAIRNRLQVYEKSTAPLVEYYQAKGKLRNLKAGGTIQAVRDQVEKALVDEA